MKVCSGESIDISFEGQGTTPAKQAKSPDSEENASCLGHSSQCLSLCSKPDFPEIVGWLWTFKVYVFGEVGAWSFRGLVENIFRSIHMITPGKIVIYLKEIIVTLDGCLNFLLLKEAV